MNPLFFLTVICSLVPNGVNILVDYELKPLFIYFHSNSEPSKRRKALFIMKWSFAVGWGNFHLGFSGSADPEPGRCRRTDGKKWRCSRDAVVDQKYCERHMNRGRHRSRKRVEGHNGHAAKAAAPGAITSSQSASAASSGGSSNNLTITEQHSKNLQSSLIEPSSVQLDR